MKPRMALDEYQRKRDFSKTNEPRARIGASATGRSFIIQKHKARQLHYDFRLELDGVLKSWSIPKGPSFDPATKRLAVAVEDHPIDYGDFEGVIPAGQYGAGTVLLWDRGVWTPLMDPHAAIDKGHLKFELVGEKLRGRWALVRLKPRGRDAAADGRNWILIKDRDAHARSESEWSVTEARPESVVSGRDLDAIATASDRVWHSKRSHTDGTAIQGAKDAPMPEWIEPARPRPARKTPDGEEWLHELEIAGEPVVIRLDAGRVQLFDPQRHDRSHALDAVLAAALALPVHQALLHGVATTLAPDGRARAGLPIDTLYVTDLLYLDGRDLTRAPLVQRKSLLATLVSKAQPAGPALRYADHVVGHGAEISAHAKALGATAIVSKRKDSRHPPAASAWRIVRCLPRAAAILQGMTASPAPTRSRQVQLANVRLTHPDRVLYPQPGITKIDLARYYERVADRMLPHLIDRPLTLVRGPDGVAGHRFFVRHAGAWAPRELRQLDITEGTGSGRAMIVDGLAGLIALAQMNVLEVHPWNARTRDLDHPDRVVFDLDPGPLVPWSDVVDGAKQVRDVLITLDLVSFVKTTGGKGLHVVVPIEPHATWDEAIEFTRAIARALARFESARFSADLGKAGRADKIFVDYLRNRRGATSVAAYSSRAQPLATVSVPVAWSALGFATRNDAHRIDNVEAWWPAPDAWAGYGRTRQRLTRSKLKAALSVARR
jgi:bifunctional non-homologous end joining protein LigD